MKTYVSAVDVDEFCSSIRRSGHSKCGFLVDGEAGNNVAMETSVLRGNTVHGRRGLGVPDNQGGVLRDGDDLLAIGGEHAAGDGSRVTVEDVHECSRRDSPHPH